MIAFIENLYIYISIFLPLILMLLTFRYKKYAPKKIFWIFTLLLFASGFADVLLFISVNYLNYNFYCQIIRAVFQVYYFASFLYFYYLIASEKAKKRYFIIMIFGIVLSILTVINNYFTSQWLFQYIGIYVTLFTLPMSIFQLFNVNTNHNKNYKYHLEPTFIFNCAGLINLGFSMLYNLFEVTLADFHNYLYDIATLIMWAGWVFYYFLLVYGMSNYKKIYDNQVDSKT